MFDSKKSLLYTSICNFGDQIPLTDQIEDSVGLVEWTESNFSYVKYNKRKNIDRWGLSITSLDGGLSGVPDLDSLYFYNIEQKQKR